MHDWLPPPIVDQKEQPEKKKLEFAEILISFSSFIDCMTYLLLTMQDLWSQHLFVTSAEEDKFPFLCRWTTFKRQTTKQVLIEKDHSIFLLLTLSSVPVPGRSKRYLARLQGLPAWGRRCRRPASQAGSRCIPRQGSRGLLVISTTYWQAALCTF